MYYSDDPVKDFENFDIDRALQERDLPICADCGAVIYDDDYACEFGQTYCPDCWEINHRGNW